MTAGTGAICRATTSSARPSPATGPRRAVSSSNRLFRGNAEVQNRAKLLATAAFFALALLCPPGVYGKTAPACKAPRMRTTSQGGTCPLFREKQEQVCPSGSQCRSGTSRHSAASAPNTPIKPCPNKTLPVSFTIWFQRMVPTKKATT